MNTWSFVAVLVGFALGFLVHRSEFCMHSALREVLEASPGPSVGAYLAALAFQVGVVNGLAAFDLLAVVVPPTEVVGAVSGGLLFGLGMVLGKG